MTNGSGRRIDISDDTDNPEAVADLTALASFLLDELGMADDALVSISLVDEEAMAVLHAEWMDEPGPTDVLSFPMDELREPAPHEPPARGVLGDVVLCPAVAERQAVVAGHTRQHELRVLLTHGVLHLLGHDHAEPDEERAMFGRQAALVSAFAHQASQKGERMTEEAWLLALAVGLVVVSWILVAAESAFAGLSRARLAESADEGDKSAQKLLKAAENPAKYVNVLLLASTITTLSALAVLIEVLLVALPGWSDGGVLVVATAVMSVVTYVVVGVSARTVGRQHPQRVAGITFGLVRLLTPLLHPLVRLLILMGNAITPGRGYRSGPFSSQAELREMLDEARAAAVIEDQERRMIHSVFELGDTTARQVMVPRTEMVFVERGKTLRQALSLALRSGFSRIPVIGEHADDVVGVVFLKDVIRRIFDSRDADRSERVDSLMREAFFVPDSKPVDELLREMQTNRVHMAIVVDEFGGTAGLVTIEDILEEIVGEIADEYDDEIPEIVRLADGSLRLSSRLSLEHLREAIGIDLDADAEGVDTLGGLLGRRLGRVPIPGAEITEQGWRLTAESAEGRRNRIGTVLATPAHDNETVAEGSHG